MDPIELAIWQSWSLDPWILGAFVLAGAIYFRGWRKLHRRNPKLFPFHRLLCYWTGITTVALALVSPLDVFASLLLQVHMVQHLLLMMIAPPLIWLGAPMLPMLKGLPGPIRRQWVLPYVRSIWVRLLFQFLTHPLVALILFTLVTWVWHIPWFYDRALRNPTWHQAEHFSFLASSLLFWYPLVQPYPSRPQCSRWVLLPYLAFAWIQSGALAALLAFTDRVWYPYYEEVPRLWGVSALWDQQSAGVIMWVPGSIVMLIPIAFVVPTLFRSNNRSRKTIVRSTEPAPEPVPAWMLIGMQKKVTLLPVLSSTEVATDRRRKLTAEVPNLLRVPVVGWLLRWRHARLVLQVPMFVLAAAVIADGLWGPSLGGMNLAGVLPWIHWRGLIVFALLVMGNVFCMACPFMLPRTISRWILPARLAWPKALRSKWIAVSLLFAFFLAYEGFELWSNPRATALIAIAYFAAAFVVDGLFRGASFCKYVCPVGQFHFFQSLVAPTEVKVLAPSLCHTCVTKDCIRGNDKVSGCELHLYQPRKRGNMDCTFCLDCVHACPHENVGIVPVVPGHDLLDEGRRSGVGRLQRRPDLVAMILFLVFAAVANAALMVAPVAEFKTELTQKLGLGDTPLLSAGLFVMLLALCTAGFFLTAAVCRYLSGPALPFREQIGRFALVLVPIGAAFWITHYATHLFGSAGAGLPVVQRFVNDLGWTFLGTPDWGYDCAAGASVSLLRAQIVILDVGLLLSLYLAYRYVERSLPAYPLVRIGAAWLPWGSLVTLLFMLGIWILFQPMQMRGAMEFAG